MDKSGAGVNFISILALCDIIWITSRTGETHMELNENNEQIQEFFMTIGDKLAPVGRAWWYTLLAVLVLALPGYFLLKTSFTRLILGAYSGPRIVYTAAAQDPLSVIDQKIFALGNGTYSGYIRIKNTNLEWGVAQQEYK